MKFIQTLKNIYNIEELRNKIAYTLILVLVYRFASYIVLPGVNPLELDKLTSATGSGILSMINTFAGGGFSRASVMALGIMPYISASIAIQLLTVAVPYFQKLQKEGESGRRQMNQITRYLTILVTMFQGFAYITYLDRIGLEPMMGVFFFKILTMIVLTAGTLFAMWIGEKITDNGIGNGISILIMIGIMAKLPGSMLNEFTSKFSGGGGGGMIIILEIAILFVIVMATIALVQAVRRIPVQYAKRNIVKDGRVLQAGGVRDYLPLKVNASGVMPIIFAQALMFLPPYIVGLFNSGGQNSDFLISISDPRRLGYNVLSFTLVVVFTYLYTAMTINPNQISDDLKKNGGFIPGVKPGQATTDYVDNVISRITLPGSIFLGIISILPAFALMVNINQGFAYFFGGTSLLIMVAVVLDTLQQVESYLLNRHYDGLTKSGRIKGRHNNVGATI